MKICLAAGGLLVGLAAGPAVAQPLITVAPVTTHRLVSKAVGDSFEIRVLLPPMIPGETTRFPVVYMTDVHNGFIVDEDHLRLMMMNDTPRFIAVGIGYPGASSIMQATVIRSRDLTQVLVKDREGGGMPVAGLLRPAVTSGGADKFLAFIRDELMPFIDARYPTDPADRGYWGDSLGGLFGSYVLFTKPETFNRYIIGSPSLWWGGEDALKLAEAYGKTHGDLRANVFIGVGGLEEMGLGAASSRMVTNVLRLESLLRAKKYPGLQLSTRIFPDESHISVVGMNLVRGLVSVFGPQSPESGLAAKYAAMVKPPPA